MELVFSPSGGLGGGGLVEAVAMAVAVWRGLAVAGGSGPEEGVWPPLCSP